MSNKENYIPFSQRNGLSAIPPQLKLGEVSPDFRRLIDYCLAKEISRVERSGIDRSYFDKKWLEVAMDFHVLLIKQPESSFDNSSYGFRVALEKIFMRAPIGYLFDVIEFFVRHPGCSLTLKNDIEAAFVNTRAAYRIVNLQIVAVGSEEQADVLRAAIADLDAVGASASRQHLVASGLALRNGNWSDSVRESIHAVEAISRRIEPDANTLGPALRALERKGYIHGSLRAAFEKLYGYTNDESGIRHALLDDVARVDEVDAIFMMGACASFVSYLIARNAAHNQRNER
jgi:hypothetical protein